MQTHTTFGHDSHRPSDSVVTLSGTASPFLMWKMTMGRHEARCVVTIGRIGLELDYLFDGSTLSSYQFDRADEVLTWARRKQLSLQQRGWERA